MYMSLGMTYKLPMSVISLSSKSDIQTMRFQYCNVNIYFLYIYMMMMMMIFCLLSTTIGSCRPVARAGRK